MNKGTGYSRTTDFRNGFGSMVLRPCGLRDSKRWIQMRSLSFLSSAPLFEHEGDLMKSRMKQVIWSMLPVWSVLVRCLARGWLTSSSVALVRSLVCKSKLPEPLSHSQR